MNGTQEMKPARIPLVKSPDFNKKILVVDDESAILQTLRFNLDRVQMLYLAAYFIAATFVLWHSYRHARSAILRQQMKWVTRGTVLSVAPFTVFYVIPYLFGSVPTMGMRISVLSLVFLLIALVAGFLGFGGIAFAAAGIAKILFYIFVVLFLVSLVMHLSRGGART